MKAHIVGNQIVYISDNYITCHHIKYKIEETLPMENSKCYYVNNDAIYVYYHYRITIINNDTKQYIQILQKFTEIHSCKLIDDMLIVFGKTNGKGKTRIMIRYSNGKEKYETRNGVFHFDISPNGQNILIFGMWNSVECGLRIMALNNFVNNNYIILDYYGPKGLYRWKGNHQFIIDLHTNHQIYLIHKTLAGGNYNYLGRRFQLDYSDQNRLIHIDADKIYFVNEKFVIIYLSDSNIIKVKAPNIIGYSSTYDSFVDSKHNIHKLRDNYTLVKYKFKYDYWCDTEIPIQIQTIVQTIIDLDLFPLDLVNEIYAIIVQFA